MPLTIDVVCRAEWSTVWLVIIPVIKKIGSVIRECDYRPNWTRSLVANLEMLIMFFYFSVKKKPAVFSRRSKKRNKTKQKTQVELC